MSHFEDLARGAESDGLRAIEDEARAELEFGEAEAAKQYLRELTLDDVAAELVQSGDRVVVDTAESRHMGVVTTAAGSIMSVDTDTGIRVSVDPRRVLVTVVEKSTSGGRAVDPTAPQSYWALLRELELIGHEISIVTRIAAKPIVGRVGVVGRDHVRVEAEGREVVVPFPQILAVIRRVESE